MEVAMKLFAVGLVSCVSMSDAWKWAIAFSLDMGDIERWTRSSPSGVKPRRTKLDS